MMSCSSEIPNGDTSKFSDLKSPEEDMVKKDYLPLKHPCMLHTQADIDRVKSNLTRSPWKDAYAQLEASDYAQSSYTEKTTRHPGSRICLPVTLNSILSTSPITVVVEILQSG